MGGSLADERDSAGGENGFHYGLGKGIIAVLWISAAIGHLGALGLYGRSVQE